MLRAPVGIENALKEEPLLYMKILQLKDVRTDKLSIYYLNLHQYMKKSQINLDLFLISITDSVSVAEIMQRIYISR